jgi:hypothetical protein
VLGVVLHILYIYGSFCFKVLGLCVAAEKKRGRKNKKNRRSSCSSNKILLLKKKVVATEIKERVKERKREKQKMSICDVVLSLYCLFCVTTFVSRLTSLSKV